MAVMQVRAVTNSYMLPAEAWCTASPRVTTAVVCATAPTALSATAASTQRPASRIARSAGTSGSGIESAPAPGSSPGPPTATPGAPGASAVQDPAVAAPTG